MRTISRKLHSGRGTSLLIALLFFAVCLTVGSLILTAATAGAARTRDRRADQQDYLAVASAARLLRDELGQHTYTSGWELVTWETGTDPDTGEPVLESAPEDITPYVTPADGDLLTDAYDSISGGSAEVARQFTVSAGQDLPPVDAELQMRDGGDAAVTLTSGDYSMQVSFSARTAESTDGGTYRYWTTSWAGGVITKGAPS